MSPTFGKAATADWTGPVARPDSRLSTFLETTGTHDLEVAHRRAIDDPEWFWTTVLAQIGIDFSTPYETVQDSSAGTPFPRWFTGGSINAARNLLEREGIPDSAVAIVGEDESGGVTTTTRGELRTQVASLAESLLQQGVVRGDRVGLFMPMVAEAAAAYLACAVIGAITVPVFSGYGPQGVATRLQLAGCTALVTADGFTRRGRWVPLWDVAVEAAKRCPDIRLVVRLESAGEGSSTMPAHVQVLPWDRAVQNRTDTPSYVELDPNDPLLIMYTSGTTGEPKGVVLTHGGLLAKVGLEFGLVFDFDTADIVLWLGDMGWMVGPLLITSGLLFGATIVLYGGALDRPDPGRLWELVAAHEVTVLGVSPTAVRSLRAAGDDWHERQNLHSLRAFITTGEAWNDSPWWWLFRSVGGERIPILNYTGGTETGGGILSCYHDRPLRACGFHGPILGMDVDVVDEQGRPVRGEAGELVVRNTWPGMTRGLWQDEGDERYLETYWSRHEGIWAHGDLARIDEDGHWFLLGRSDDTLKIAGKRVGPAEVETAILAHPDAVSAVAIGVPDEAKGQSVVCFVVPTQGAQIEGLTAALQQLVIDQLGRSLAPSAIHLVPQLPATKTGKIMRRLVKAAHLGEPTGDTTGLEDARALDDIPRIADPAPITTD